MPRDEYHFNNDKTLRDGFCSTCKECRGYKFTKPKLQAKEGYKICSKCEQEKLRTTEFFSIRKDSKDGFRDQCRICTLSNKKEYYQGNIDYFKGYRIEHKEHINEYNFNYRIENADYFREYYANEDNKKRGAKTKREWKKNNRDKEIITEQRRRVRKLQLPNTFTLEQWENCLKYF